MAVDSQACNGMFLYSFSEKCVWAELPTHGNWRKGVCKRTIINAKTFQGYLKWEKHFCNLELNKIEFKYRINLLETFEGENFWVSF